eukprot:CAMPEP_0170092634 /NCGR_PEP_ID=MMETSP0019_2-20121128/25943_1 /TAXON_ID=98059 /ORGANISM="Dinobryon sp., Strain UTEXLB2267" /LENGTH=438 /DNA_ID=CAMNT_0010313143 /DNA_START=328 /DNA_END=1641 /DNA_ORIENTATION=-
MQQILILKIQLNQVNESLLTVIQDAKIIESDPNRSPSPPPKYDSSGKRTNLREVRMRDALLERRSKIIEEIMKLNPTFPTPVDFLKTKPVRRIFLPKQTNPLYNPIGLIIGPRGNTQKQLEQETGCKISVRGKGSAKEGSKGRATKIVDEDEELHVHIIGDDEEKVEKAAKLIEDILKPDDENLNVYKQRQLRELALINGTLREDEYCPICGEKGHKQFECPHRAKAFKAAAVKCALCGDLSHPTRDCPLKSEGPTNEVALDSEYDSFLAELGEGPGGRPAAAVPGGTTAAPAGTAGPAGGTAASGTASAASKGYVTRGGQTFMPPIVDLFGGKAPASAAVAPVMTMPAPFLLPASASVAPAPVMTMPAPFLPPPAISTGYMAMMPPANPYMAMMMPPGSPSMPFPYPAASFPAAGQQPPLPTAPLPATSPPGQAFQY